MKLYYATGACSLSPRIVLQEAEIPFTAVKVDVSTHTLQDGADYYTVNPKGYVPVLEFDNGERLTEGPAIVQYIADQVPEKKLAPANGTMARYRLQEALNFVTSEIHKSYSPLFRPEIDETTKAFYRTRLRTRYELLDRQLAGKTYWFGDTFSVADAYLFTVTSWAPHVKVDLSGLAALDAYMQRVRARPAVQAALKAEGLTA
ncbi:glutathione transferase GstA [Trinickia terrae]|uniref:Glutathione transferase GstA n=1 Tax=Trinickia terrae TaxID=2571161 RepID=A0A4U1I514_9BURK|nr:glutathione transferase GstA [Trinickia terrae]TKC88401.1 glutathione transferase GstA [Trinickia terrae]